MVDGHPRNIGNRNKLDMPSFRFLAGQRQWAVHLWNDFAETSGNIEESRAAYHGCKTPS